MTKGLRRLLVLVAFLTSIVVPVAPSGASGVLASAETFTQVVKFKVDRQRFLPCPGSEIIEASGVVQIVIHVTVDNNGGVHTKVLDKETLSGVGLTTGTKYHVKELRSVHNFQGSGGLPITITFVDQDRVISQGKGQNFLLHTLFHITVNENGEITAELQKIDIRCQMSVEAQFTAGCANGVNAEGAKAWPR
jgi:hypothetical protein